MRTLYRMYDVCAAINNNGEIQISQERFINGHPCEEVVLLTFDQAMSLSKWLKDLSSGGKSIASAGFDFASWKWPGEEGEEVEGNEEEESQQELDL